MIEIYFFRICKICRHTNLNIQTYIQSSNDYEASEELIISCGCDEHNFLFRFGICPWAVGKYKL